VMMRAMTGAGLISFTSFAAFAQQLAVAPPAFEVASIRPSAPGGRGVSLQIAPGGRFTATNASLRSLIKMAYGVRDFQISGGPGWLNADRFNITSKADGNPSEDQVRLMVQTLLANRFKLKVRREMQEFTVYTLVEGKHGPKLKEAKQVEDNSNRGVRVSGPGRLTGLMASTSQLAEVLSDVLLNGVPILDRPVLDRTGLTGSYDFTLTWTPETSPVNAGGATSDTLGPSIFTAVQQQLGLKLEVQKAPVEVLMIDHAERASEN
jgi:uncharacterized protein (TIGR03435 family)